ncbi:MAG: HIT family protein [Gammaproteobacteria bacterium]|nr:HIT family protein [Gammaproteobacteria bacterium]MBT8151433.1 HIT family protein [Gammaproteobacteria bacterium]NND39556.1 HIT family protein [Pseudomonadales bacterium]RZV52151.1 MAG: HIT family protein [Pseudomonadales bacterium]
MKDCIFCALADERILMGKGGMLLIEDAYPVTQGHSLVFPKRHVETWFDLSDEERATLDELLIQQRKVLLASDPSITGFNIGTNCGEAAGQTIPHCHVHLIPRRAGDVENPRGGVRGVIPEQQQY